MGIVGRDELEELLAAEEAAKSQAAEPPAPPPPPQEDHTAALRQQINELNARLAAAEARVNAPPPPPPAPAPKGPAFTEDDLGAGADPQAFERKIDEKLDVLLTNKTRPIAEATASTQAMLAMQVAEAQLPYFKQFKPLILQAAQQMTPQQLADIRTWHFLHNTVVGANVDQIVTSEVNRRNNTPPPSETGDHQRPGGGSKVQLSSDEQRFAQLLGADLEDARLMKEFLNG